MPLACARIFRHAPSAARRPGGRLLLERLAARTICPRHPHSPQRELRARAGDGPEAGTVSPPIQWRAAKGTPSRRSFVEQAAQRPAEMWCWPWRSWPMSPSNGEEDPDARPQAIWALVWHTHLSMRVAFKIPDFHYEMPQPRYPARPRRHRLSAQQGRDALASQLLQYSSLELLVIKSAHPSLSP